MRLVSVAALLFAFAASFASAQPPGGPPPLPPAAIRSAPERTRAAPPNALPQTKGQETRRWARDLRRSARNAAADGYREADVLAAYERDLDGNWFRRGEIVVAGASPAVMATAVRMGFIERRRTALVVGVELVTFAAPPGMDTRVALQALQQLHPETQCGLNYLYAQQGSGNAPPVEPPRQHRVARATVAVIDGPIPINSALFAGVRFTTRRFVVGAPSSNRHGAAVAAILARATAATDLRVIAADVVSAGPLEGAVADDIARALDWAAAESASVINVSLTGPPHPALARVSAALAARGYIIVAAAGNAGPQAPPPYPAALSDVVGVTAVDSRGRIWRRATRGAQVDFAALGVDVATDGGSRVSGTSYATPIVAGVLARLLTTPDRRRRAEALEQLAASARDLGPPGPDATFGRGLIEAN